MNDNQNASGGFRCIVMSGAGTFGEMEIHAMRQQDVYHIPSDVITPRWAFLHSSFWVVTEKSVTVDVEAASPALPQRKEYWKRLRFQ